MVTVLYDPVKGELRTGKYKVGDTVCIRDGNNFGEVEETFRVDVDVRGRKYWQLIEIRRPEIERQEVGRN